MSFRRRLTYSLFALSIVVVAVQFGLLYRTNYHVFFREIRGRLVSIAKSATLMVDYRLHEAMTGPAQENTPDYARAIAPLGALLNQLPRIRYIYTIKKIDGHYYFILDPTPMGDHDGDGIDDKSHIMQEYTDIDTETRSIIDAVLIDGEARAQHSTTTDRWGTFLSSFAPLVAPDGHIYAVVGIDMQFDELQKNLSEFTHPALWSLLIALVAAVGLSGLLASYHRQVLGKFKTAIESLSSDQTVDLPFKNKNDEFGRIARTFYQMKDVIQMQKRKLREKIHELERQRDETYHAHQETLSALSALKEAQSALVQSQKLAALGQLGAGLAHELNSPLAATLEMSRQILDETAPTHPDYELFSQMKDACEHMARVVKSISLFSRHKPSERVPIHIQEAMNNALVLLNHRLKSEKIEIYKQFCDKDPLVWGNLPKLQEVFLNLYINACDAMELVPAGSAKQLRLNVDVVFRQNKYWVGILISDTGSGITADIADQIFNPFFTTKQLGKGTGLGLSICYGIVKDHEGEIHATSDGKQGTTFEILLPLYTEQSAHVSV